MRVLLTITTCFIISFGLQGQESLSNDSLNKNDAIPKVDSSIMNFPQLKDKFPKPNLSKFIPKLSIFKLPKNRVKSDSLNILPDSLVIDSNSLKLPFTGQLNWEYLQGYNPFAIDTNIPLEIYRAHGSMDMNIATLPWNLQYNYSPQNELLGMNNYFRLNFDVRRFQQQLGLKKFELKDSISSNYLDLEKQQESLYGQKLYLESLLEIDNLTDFDEFYSPEDSLKIEKPNIPDAPTIPGANLPKIELSDSISKINELQELNEKKNEVQSKIDKINTTISDINKKKQLIQDKINYIDSGIPSPNLLRSKEFEGLSSKKESILTNIRKFQIGMSTPEYSPILLSGTSINGVNLEYSGKKYLAFAHGITANQLFVSSNPIDNTLKSARNVYNFFDFNGVNNGKRITAIKGGVGDREKTHFHVGVLQGFGRTIPLNNEINSNIPKDENYVIELDGRVTYGKKNFFQVNYAKSYLHSALTDTLDLKDGFKSIISKERSNAMFASNHLQFEKINSELTTTFRWIDPHYQSFGMGFLREDNIRYEIKSKHRLTRKVKLQLKLRKERDNLLDLYEYKNVLTSFGGQVNWKVLKSVNFSLGYFPVFHKFTSPDFQSINKNYITNSVITFTQHNKSIFQFLTIAFNNYKLSNDSIDLNFQNYNLMHEIRLQENFSILNNLNFMQSSDAQDSSNFIFTSHGILLKPLKKVTTTGQIKTSYSLSDNTIDVGYKGSLEYQAFKTMSIQLSYEKFLNGEFYQSFDNYETNTGQTPYLISFKVVNTF